MKIGAKLVRDENGDIRVFVFGKTEPLIKSMMIESILELTDNVNTDMVNIPVGESLPLMTLEGGNIVKEEDDFGILSDFTPTTRLEAREDMVRMKTIYQKLYDVAIDELSSAGDSFDIVDNEDEELEEDFECNGDCENCNNEEAEEDEEEANDEAELNTAFAVEYVESLGEVIDEITSLDHIDMVESIMYGLLEKIEYRRQELEDNSPEWSEEEEALAKSIAKKIFKEIVQGE